MAVLLETSLGDLVIELSTTECPLACKNFLKLCKLKYFNNITVHNVQRNFLALTGDPENSGGTGTSVYGLSYGLKERFFDHESCAEPSCMTKSFVLMATPNENHNGSAFYITLPGFSLTSVGHYTIFGEISEGYDTLEHFSDAPPSRYRHPTQNISIVRTCVLNDPFHDIPGMVGCLLGSSADDSIEQYSKLSNEMRQQEKTEYHKQEELGKNEAILLELIGDLPDVNIKPANNVLFICKLNSVTSETDLELIFSQFGKVISCDVVRERKSGESLCYGFIGYDSNQACQTAFFNMNNAVIDDRRIKVDFSQSVSHLWRRFHTRK